MPLPVDASEVMAADPAEDGSGRRHTRESAPAVHTDLERLAVESIAASGCRGGRRGFEAVVQVLQVRWQRGGDRRCRAVRRQAQVVFGDRGAVGGEVQESWIRISVSILP
jgi:hypothetical protein